jgi:hypothetical protein
VCFPSWRGSSSKHSRSTTHPSIRPLPSTILHPISGIHYKRRRGDDRGNAIVDELKAHGFDENGRPMKQKASDTRANSTATPASNGLKGGLRLHVQAPLVPAKYVDVKAEVGQVIKTIMMAMNPEKNKAALNRNPVGGSSRHSFPEAGKKTLRFTRHKT